MNASAPVTPAGSATNLVAAPGNLPGARSDHQSITADFGKGVWLHLAGIHHRDRTAPGYAAAVLSRAQHIGGGKALLSHCDYQSLCEHYGPQDDADCDPNAPHICAASYRIAARQQQGLPILTTPEVQQARQVICQSCDACVPVTHHASRITESLCKLSACSMSSKIANKIKYVHETCPQGLWPG